MEPSSDVETATTPLQPQPFILPSPIPESKTKEHGKIISALSPLRPVQVSKAFSANFTHDERSFHSIPQITGHPEIMQTYPQFESGILDAYLANTLFILEVRTPYDVASKTFSTDFSGCGTIIPPDVVRERNNDDTTPYNTQVNRVRFDIRSPFSGVLCRVLVTHEPEHMNDQGQRVGDKITAGVSPVIYGHELLSTFLDEACQKIQAQKLVGNHVGLSYQNLEAMATYFVPRTR